MSLDLLPPLDLGSLLGLGGDPGAAVSAGQTQTQDEIAGRNVLGNPGGTGGLLRSLIGIGPDADTIAKERAALVAQQHQTQLNAARNAALMNPSAANFQRLFVLDPASHESIKAAYDAMNADQQRTELEHWSALRGYAAAGDPDGFKAEAQKRLDADKAAGRDIADDQHVLAMADNPQSLKALGGFFDSKIAAVLGPDKWQEAFKPGQDAATAEETHRHNLAEEAAKAAELNKPVVVAKDSVLVDPNTPAGPAQGAAPAEAPTPAPTGGNYDAVASAAAQAGATPAEQNYLRRLAQVESRGNPKARNGSSRGIFQFHPDTFAGAGGGDINSVQDQTRAALHLARSDAVALQHAGLPVTDSNLYLLHQQGAAGGLALLAAPPETGAVAAVSPAYRNAKTAQQAIVNNGGSAGMTAGDFVGNWRFKWSGGAAPAQGGQPQGGARVLFDNRQPETDDIALTPAAVDLAAGKYLRDGTLPTFGGGKIGAQNKLAIYNRAAEMAAALGMDANDIVAGTANTKALGQALGRSTTMLSQIQGSEQTVLKNIDFAMTLAPKGVGHTVPVFNRWEQHLRGEYGGDPSVTSFDNALHTVADEYAKVMTTSTGTGGAPTSDSARQEAYRRITTAQTLDQLQGTVNVMKTEMANRIASLKDVNEGLRTQLRTGPGGNAAASSAAGAPAPASAPPAAPRVQPNSAQITMLKSKPNLWKDFDAKFGPGASSHVLNPDKYGPLP